MSQVQVDEVVVERPDFETLQKNRCSQLAKAAFSFGFLAGGTVGGFYGGSKALRIKANGPEFPRIIGRNILKFGGSLGAVMCIGSMLRCP